MYIWCNFPIQSHLLVCVHVFTAHVRPPISSPVPALCTSGNTHCFRITFLCPRVRFLHCTFSSVWVWVYSSIMFSHFLHCTQRWFCWVRVVTLLFIHRFPVPFPVCFIFLFCLIPNHHTSSNYNTWNAAVCVWDISSSFASLFALHCSTHFSSHVAGTNTTLESEPNSISLFRSRELAQTTWASYSKSLVVIEQHFKTTRSIFNAYIE